MIILGIDPGSRRAGYGVLERADRRETVLAYGVINLDGQDSHQLRLKQIYDRLTALTEQYPPDECAIEMPVYGRNPQSMLKLGRAQAAAMLVALNRSIPVVEYTPKEVKKSATGNGNASKQQVRYMIKSILSIDDTEKTLQLDASDALAVALCHAQRQTQDQSASYSSWSNFVKDNPDRIA